MDNVFFSHEITDTYDVIGEIGQGGGGTVYEAYHKRLRKKVVLKRQHDAIRGLVNERTETDTLKNLRHSNLPQVLDFIVTDDSVYTVMDYIPGQSVKELLKEQGKLDENVVIKYARQLCDALVYLHNSKPPVIHGDIKPDNIMITPDGDVCLIDFNISSALGAANSYAFGYTLGYAAPEQRRSFELERDRIKAQGNTKSETNGESDYEHTEILGSDENSDKAGANPHGVLFDKRSDIYSFGATLYHMLSGIKPSSDPAGIRPINEIYPLMNKGLADIITRSMNPDPADRYQSFDEIKKILDNIKKYDLKYRAKVMRTVIIACVLAVIAGVTAAALLINIKKSGAERFKAGLDEATSLYYSSDYEASIDMIDSELIGKKYLGLDESYLGSAFYLRGNDYLELEQYDYAIEDFDKAIEYDDSNILTYRDKAIALARLGKNEEALDVISDAESIGSDNTDLLLAKAQISASAGDIDEAIDLYEQCILETDDDQIKARAYLMCSDLLDSTNKEDLSKAISMLQDATKLNSSLQVSIMQRLAQKHLDMAKLTGASAEYENARDVFIDITENGWDTYSTHDNLAILYEQLGDLDSAEEELQEMLDKYSENYNTYKRLAFLEVEKQNTILSSERDYEPFKEYADRAKELYDNQSMITDDMEMNVLNELRSQIE